MQSRTLSSEERHHSSRRHAPQISISDTDHHVTEAIGGMYESDEEEYASPKQRKDPRPLSYLSSPKEVYEAPNSSYFDTKRTSPTRTPLAHTMSNERIPPSTANGAPPKTSPSSTSPANENGPLSPPPLSRHGSSETAVQQFPLNDIDYESSPAAVAQELSNLQAIRRMSMNVDTGDPDLPSFATGFGTPSVPTSPSGDEDDTSRLFWVPARLHPELAPVEFKTFIEDRVDKMKRRSDGEDTLSPGSIESQGSGSLKRKKSMLSRQINSARGYEDGAERLERKRSEGRGDHEASAIENLSELESLVNDPSSLVRKLSLDTSRRSFDSAVDVPMSEDLPILPNLSLGLKRSTRTAYRRGSLRKGERGPLSRRAIGRQAETDADESPASSPVVASSDDPMPGLSRVQTEPAMMSAVEQAENFSRPVRTRRPGLASSASTDDIPSRTKESSPPVEDHERANNKQGRPQPFHSRIASNGRTTAHLPGEDAPAPQLPQIVATPPPQDRTGGPPYMFPERRSSHQPPPPAPMIHPPPPGRPHSMRSDKPRLPLSISKKEVDTTLNDISQHPSPLPGSGSSRTDDLTMVPTFDNKKADRKDGSRKPGWGWLLGSEEKDREKERERDKEREKDREREKERERAREKEDKEKESLRKPKVSSKLARQPDKTRLDVLQTSIDGGGSRGRESLVLDRESVKLEEERRKESTRRSTDTGKREKDGIFSSIFGGVKRSKVVEDHSQKKRISNNRGLSPEPPPRILKPDIDYNWTRFSILEERAIYRMAHIKLANPKRALYSQVLLSNFMYSYLAKVQMMHPQMQIPGGQKAAQQQQQQQKAESNGRKSEGQSHSQSEEYVQYQRWQEQQAREESGGQPDHGHDGGNYGSGGNMDDAGSYSSRPQLQRNASRDTGPSYGGGATDQQQQQQQQHLMYSKQTSQWDDDDDGDESNMFDGL